MPKLWAIKYRVGRFLRNNQITTPIITAWSLKWKNVEVASGEPLKTEKCTRMHYFQAKIRKFLDKLPPKQQQTPKSQKTIFKTCFTVQEPLMTLNSLYCADVPLSNYSLTHSLTYSAGPNRVRLEMSTSIKCACIHPLE